MMSDRKLRIAYRGNFLPNLPPGVVPWSTEYHIAGSLELLGHTVIRVQEDQIPWADTVGMCKDADLFLWTSTYGYAHMWDQRQAWAAVEKLNDMLPTAAFHLDKFWDLPRESQVTTEPWFRLSTIATADGGNQDRWAAHNINHIYLPPGVYGPECVLGTPNPQYASDIAFVGNWQGGYHPEWGHRKQLVSYLRRQYRPTKMRFWPARHQIRGKALSDLYASVKLIVGDSCLVGSKGRYSSDRIPETLGRGGFLIHPRVEGVTDGTLYTEHQHLACWDLYNWKELGAKIHHYLNHDEEREAIRREGFEHVRNNHTYECRMSQLLNVIFADNASTSTPSNMEPTSA